MSNGGSLRLVDAMTGAVLKTVKVPGEVLSLDPTGKRLYVLTGTGGTTPSGNSYSSGTVVEIDATDGQVIASASRLGASLASIFAAAKGVFVIKSGSAENPVQLLGAATLAPVPLPSRLETELEANPGSGPDVAVAQTSTETFLGSRGALTCLAQNASETRSTLELELVELPWTVFANRGTTVYAWSTSRGYRQLPSSRQCSRLRAAQSDRWSQVVRPSTLIELRTHESDRISGRFAFAAPCGEARFRTGIGQGMPPGSGLETAATRAPRMPIE